MVRQLTVQRERDETAATDSLTGLATRARFHELLARGLDRDARAGFGTAVLLIDLNGFKLVNDTLGHKAGDRLLTSSAPSCRPASWAWTWPAGSAATSSR
jgi:diguanylate cyclase (GGDEF)-like protein